MTAPWLQTYTGRRAEPFALQPDQVCIEDIAHHLAAINRFCGASRLPYSVAQHSVMVSCALYAGPATAEMSLAGLLHDAAEAYFQDIVAPVKRFLLVDAAAFTDLPPDVSYVKFSVIEKAARQVILGALGLEGVRDSWPQFASILDLVDLRALATEKRDLMAPEPYPWIELPEPMLRTIDDVWTAPEAEARFLARYHDLRGLLNLSAQAEQLVSK